MDLLVFSVTNYACLMADLDDNFISKLCQSSQKVNQNSNSCSKSVTVGNTGFSLSPATLLLLLHSHGLVNTTLLLLLLLVLRIEFAKKTQEFFFDLDTKNYAGKSKGNLLKSYNIESFVIKRNSSYSWEFRFCALILTFQHKVPPVFQTLLTETTCQNYHLGKSF